MPVQRPKSAMGGLAQAAAAPPLLRRTHSAASLPSQQATAQYTDAFVARPLPSTTLGATPKPALDTRPAAVIARISEDPSLLATYPQSVRNNPAIFGAFSKSDPALDAEENRRRFSTVLYAGDAALSYIREHVEAFADPKQAKEFVQLDTRYLRVIKTSLLDSARFALTLGPEIVFGDEEAAKHLTPRLRQALAKILFEQDVQAATAEVARDPELLAYLPEALQNNAEVVLAAIAQDSSHLTHAGYELKTLVARFAGNDWQVSMGRRDTCYLLCRDNVTSANAAGTYLVQQVGAYKLAWANDRQLSPKRFWESLDKPAYTAALGVAVKRDRSEKLEISFAGARADKPTLTDILPNELVLQILQYLTPFERAQVAPTSHALQKLADASFTDLVPDDIASPQVPAKTAWVRDFRSLFPSEQRAVSALAKGASPTLFSMPIFEAYVRRFAGDVYASSDAETLMMIHAEALPNERYSDLTLANACFWKEAGSTRARQLATSLFKETYNSSTWVFHGNIRATRSRLMGATTGKTLQVKNSAGREIQLRKLAPHAAQVARSSVQFEAVPRNYEPEFLLEFPDERVLYLDRPKYDSSSENVRAFFGTHQGLKRVAVRSYYDHSNNTGAQVMLRGGMLEIPGLHDEAAPTFRPMRLSHNPWRGDDVIELAHLEVSRAADYGVQNSAAEVYVPEF